jgi:hypothetical protein
MELRLLHNGHDNGDLFLSIREAARRLGGCSKNLASKAFAELRDRGFVRPNERGGFDYKAGARQGRGTTWILTDCGTNWCAGAKGEGRYLMPPTKDFMTWVPPNSESTVPQRRTDGPSKKDTASPHPSKLSSQGGHFCSKSVLNGPSREDTGMFARG